MSTGVLDSTKLIDPYDLAPSMPSWWLVTRCVPCLAAPPCCPRSHAIAHFPPYLHAFICLERLSAPHRPAGRRICGRRAHQGHAPCTLCAAPTRAPPRCFGDDVASGSTAWMPLPVPTPAAMQSGAGMRLFSPPRARAGVAGGPRARHGPRTSSSPALARRVAPHLPTMVRLIPSSCTLLASSSIRPRFCTCKRPPAVPSLPLLSQHAYPCVLQVSRRREHRHRPCQRRAGGDVAGLVFRRFDGERSVGRDRSRAAVGRQDAALAAARVAVAWGAVGRVIPARHPRGRRWRRVLVVFPRHT